MNLSYFLNIFIENNNFINNEIYYQAFYEKQNK